MGLLDLLRGTPSQDKFARLMLQAMQQANVQGGLHYDAQRFAITLKNLAGDDYTANLHNVYRDYCHATSGAARQDALVRYACGTAEAQMALPADYASARRKLLPLVRGVVDEALLYESFAQEATDTPHDPAKRLASRALCADIVVQLGFDSELNIRRLNAEVLAEWGVDFDTALADALDNLRLKEGDRWTALQPGSYIGAWADYYDTSRLLLTDALYRLALTGDPVVLAPTRETLLVTGSRDTAGQALVLATAQEALKSQSRQVSMAMLRYDGSAWHTFMPEGASGDLLHELQQQQLGADYAQQKEMLDQVLDKRGEDIFVASFKLMRKTEGDRVISFCTWTEGVDSLLPKTDLVILIKVGPDQQIAAQTAVPWAQVMELAGQYLEPTRHIQARFRARTFPSQTAFTALVGRNVL